MSDILISVVIPTYHRNDLLARCLEQLAPGKQVLEASRYEVIVTDDGNESTAESMIRSQFPWAKWVKGAQRGPASNRNSGARNATAKWIAFTDDDCVPTPEWLSAYRNAIEDNIAVYEGKTTCKDGFKPWIEAAPVNLTGGYLWSCNMMVARSQYEALDGFDENFPLAMMEDVDFLVRVQQAHLTVKWVPDAVIDHPARLRRVGANLGNMWESRVLFIYKHHLMRSVLWWLPMHIIKVRAGDLLKIGFRRELLSAFPAIVFEWFYVLVHMRRWQNKYREQFKPKDI